MSAIHIKKGLNVPISGLPEQEIEDISVHKVAILGPDYHGMSADLQIKQGDRVKQGQLLFTNRNIPAICYTSPAGGVIEAINRGEKRSLLSIVIRVDDHEEAIDFSSYPVEKLGSLNNQQVRDNLVASGLWTSFRTRPFSRVPAPNSTAHAIFINAMDSNPLAPDPQIVIQGHTQDFINGIQVLTRLDYSENGNLYLCTAAGADIPHPQLDKLIVTEFAGPHPAGLTGTHINRLSPVSRHKRVWSLNYQDVIAIGKLFATGKLFVERVISLAGPQVKRPRLLRTRLGAAINELVSDELRPGDNRIVSGSILSGHQASDELAYLGRYHLQVSVLLEGREKEFLGWLRPGKEKFSMLNIFTSNLTMRRQFPLTTTTGGENRAMIPIGTYEDVVPLDILPTPLLRALIIKDTDAAQALGCLELDEEDLALCTFVCPGKHDYGLLLRECLNRIEKEG